MNKQVPHVVKDCLSTDAAVSTSTNSISLGTDGESSKSSVSPSDAFEAEPPRVRSLEEVGLGVDIVEIERMKKILARTPSFKTKVFSEEEQAYCDKKGVPEIHYATRFAAKEAVLKALGTGFAEGIRARDVEVVRNAKGKPSVVLYRRAKEVARELGVVELPLSLSYTHSEAVACAMAITVDSMKASEKRADPMEDLAKQFKQARAMLDEIDVLPITTPPDAAEKLIHVTDTAR